MLSIILAITLLAPATSYVSRPLPVLTPDEQAVIALAEEVPAGYADPALTTLLRHARQLGPGTIFHEDPELIRFSPGEDGHERALALGRSIVGRPMMFTVQLVRLVEHHEIPKGVEHWLARLPSDRWMSGPPITLENPPLDDRDLYVHVFVKHWPAQAPEPGQSFLRPGDIHHVTGRAYKPMPVAGVRSANSTGVSVVSGNPPVSMHRRWEAAAPPPARSRAAFWLTGGVVVSMMAFLACRAILRRTRSGFALA